MSAPVGFWTGIGIALVLVFVAVLLGDPTIRENPVLLAMTLSIPLAIFSVVIFGALR